MPALINRVGQRQGRLLVLEFAGRNGKRQPLWLCQCDCGSRITLKSHALTEGTESCGCLRLDVMRSLLTKHGHAGERRGPEYAIWQGMKSRCFNRNNAAYSNYGGRGIIVCDRWKESFGYFLGDMGPRPSSRHTLDRYPNNDGNYEPGNCRWATPEEQHFNKRSTIILDCNGERLTTLEASRRFGIPIDRINGRRNDGWTDDRAATTPVNNARSGGPEIVHTDHQHHRRQALLRSRQGQAHRPRDHRAPAQRLSRWLSPCGWRDG